jgi:hypothetical protein
MSASRQRMNRDEDCDSLRPGGTNYFRLALPEDDGASGPGKCSRATELRLLAFEPRDCTVQPQDALQRGCGWSVN